MGLVKKECDLLVVGGGLAGLSCARLAALAGLRVVVAERQSQVGGHLLPFTRGSLQFEVGLHYIADCGEGSRWQDALNKLQIRLPTAPLDHFFEQVRREKTREEWALPANLDEAIELFARRYPQHAGHGLGWETLRSDLNLVWECALRTPFPADWADLAKVAFQCRNPLRLLKIARLSAAAYLQEELCLSAAAADDVLLQHVLLGAAPNRLSALIFLLVHRYYYERPCFVTGGGRAIRDELLHADVTYLTSCPVTSVRETFGGASTWAAADTSSESQARLRQAKPRFQVEAGPHSVRCRDIVYTADPRQLRDLCKFTLPVVLRARLARVRSPHALVVGYFATRATLQELGFRNSNYWLQGNLSAAESYVVNDLNELARSAPLYVSTGSLRDPAHPASGGEFQAMFLAPPVSDIWRGGGGRPHVHPSADEDLGAYRLSESRGGFRRPYLQMKNAILRQLEERLLCQFPALKGQLSWSELGTPLTHHRYLLTSTLGGYGYEASVSDVLWGRPGWKSGKTGLYLAGAFTRPSHGILTSLLNGVGVAEKIVQDAQCRKVRFDAPVARAGRQTPEKQATLSPS